jgi:AcrR family transcriptional regulator
MTLNERGRPRVSNPTPRRGRRPGRPPVQADGPDQRQRLVDIALELFGRQGYAETTLAAIARAAGMTPAAVHYYFKTRDDLFDTLYEERIAPMRKRIEGIFLENADDPVAAFTALAKRFVEVSIESPWMGPVFFGELLREDDLFKQHIQARMNETRHAALLGAIHRWQDKGLLNKDLDPALLMTTVLSLTVLPMTAMRNWRDDPHRNHIDAEVITRHAIAVLNHGFHAPKA